MNLVHIPLEPHSYFRALNKDSEKTKFLASNTYEPDFRYGKILTKEYIYSKSDLFHKTVKGSHNFDILESAIDLNEGLPVLDRYTKANRAIYTEPDTELTSIILHKYLEFKKIFNNNSNFITSKVYIPSSRKLDIVPPAEIFLRIKSYMECFLGENPMVETEDLTYSIRLTLESLGLSKVGWEVIPSDDDRAARVNHKTKTIRIGRYYNGKSTNHQKYILAHEVYGHVLRGPRNDILDSEGFATMLEQLMNNSFRFRRAYRYLAIALGLGYGGDPRAFRDVFEILWRVMSVMTYRFSQARARSFAFDECYRAFRGSSGRVPGAVYLKDSTYFHANIKAWRSVCDKGLNYNQFTDVMAGNRSIL